MNHLCIPTLLQKTILILESQNHVGLKWPLEIIWSNLLLKAGPQGLSRALDKPSCEQQHSTTFLGNLFQSLIFLTMFLVFFFFACLHPDGISPEATSAFSLLSCHHAALRREYFHLLHKYALDIERLNRFPQGFSSVGWTNPMLSTFLHMTTSPSLYHLGGPLQSSLQFFSICVELARTQQSGHSIPGGA